MNHLQSQQLEWPNKVSAKVSPIRTARSLVVPIMAPKSVVNYMVGGSKGPMPDAELHLQVDPSLAFENPVPEQVYRPPGIQTLRQWGEQIFPEGKHLGATFIQVYNKDAKYTMYMKSHSNLTSPWAKSFQNFVKVMGMPLGSQSACLTPKASSAVSSSISEWDLLGSPADQMPTIPWSLKRGQPEPAIEENGNPMNLEKDVDKEQYILTQMAILQRELDRMKGEQ